MRYIDSIVTAPEERILHRARLHWTIFLRPSSLLTLLVLPLVRWLTCEAVVTSRRIVIANGWLSRRTFELPLSRFESIRVEQNVAARILGYGSVLVVGVGGGRQGFAHMSRPLAFRRAAEQAIYGD
ncbi:PH domain-containing protein [Anaeromyxobacter sp. PSR-1]|uniref:PH domain-containing protein n=1 Tax=Anaeromyxobacter sp. PSR-1 TaxID=1300915 RepID=UPI0005E3C022|nr:PH domain-containing protein [Anaeromyxobacter sp. PSR-1]GAO01277.1 bacterial membrane flanked domain protein [Anaeromyxobacter sp. PSR-1]